MNRGAVWWGLLGWIALCLAVELLAAFLTSLSVKTWFPTLVRPVWRPPDWLFGPVWTLLYLSMAVAAWRVWRRVGWDEGRWALQLFVVQLGLNAAWSWVFFGLQAPGWAFVEIGLLWLAIVGTMVSFFRIDSFAGVLLIPYLLWVSYAAALNGAIWRMNR